MHKKTRTKWLKSQRNASNAGQAIAEYTILVLFSVGLMVLLANAMKRPILSLWEFYAKQIAPPCPGCHPDPAILFR